MSRLACSTDRSHDNAAAKDLRPFAIHHLQPNVQYLPTKSCYLRAHLDQLRCKMQEYPIIQRTWSQISARLTCPFWILASLASTKSFSLSRRQELHLSSATRLSQDGGAQLLGFKREHVGAIFTTCPPSCLTNYRYCSLLLREAVTPFAC